MLRLMLKAKSLMEREEGQGMVEYALILFLVSVVAIGALTAIGISVKEVLQTVANKLPG